MQIRKRRQEKKAKPKASIVITKDKRFFTKDTVCMTLKVHKLQLKSGTMDGLKTLGWKTTITTSKSKCKHEEMS